MGTLLLVLKTWLSKATPHHRWVYVKPTTGMRKRGVQGWRICNYCGREQIIKCWYGGWRWNGVCPKLPHTEET